MGKLGSLETFAKEKESLNFKLDFRSENVAVEILKYMFLVLGSQGQIVDIGQFEDICGKKGEFEFQV